LEKFQKRLTSIHSRQAMHAGFCGFLGSYEESPGGEAMCRRRHKLTNLISGFLMNCLSVMNTRQATQTNFG